MARPGVEVAVVSGRGLADVRERAAIPGIAYAGNHGMEIHGPGIDRIHPEAAAARPVLERAAASCARRMDGHPRRLRRGQGAHPLRAPPPDAARPRRRGARHRPRRGRSRWRACTSRRGRRCWRCGRTSTGTRGRPCSSCWSRCAPRPAPPSSTSATTAPTRTPSARSPASPPSAEGVLVADPSPRAHRRDLVRPRSRRGGRGVRGTRRRAPAGLEQIANRSRAASAQRPLRLAQARHLSRTGRGRIPQRLRHSPPASLRLSSHGPCAGRTDADGHPLSRYGRGTAAKRQGEGAAAADARRTPDREKKTADRCGERTRAKCASPKLQ